MRPALRPIPALVSALVLWGCSGVVGGGSPTGAGSAGTSGGGTAGNAVGGGGNGATAGAAGAGAGVVTGTAGDGALATCPTTAATPTPLRRLTKFEYANTARNLLGVDTTPVNDLPADEVTDGFNNNAGVLTVSSLHAEKYVLVSEALAKSAVKNLSALTGGCNTTTKGEDACATEFANAFGRRAFRRPVTDQDRQILMGGVHGGPHRRQLRRGDRGDGPRGAAVVEFPLSSGDDRARQRERPAGAAQPVRAGDAAVVPDLGGGPRRRAAGCRRPRRAGRPSGGGDEGARDARRSEGARRVTDFYNQWIGTSRLDIMTKSTSLFPQYSDAVRDAMKLETPAFVEYVLWTGDHKLSTLLTSPTAFVSSALAPIYGVTTTSTTPQMMSLPAAQARAGILTQASFLAVQAHPDQTSPVLRGKFVRTKLMCQTVPPPPMDVDITPPAVTSAATARDRFGAHEMAGGSCMNCHQLMDPIGFAFESFDAIGKYRTTENGATINLSGNILAATDPSLNGTFTGVKELATKLAASDQVRDCVATQWFRYAAGRTEEVPDGCSLTTLQDAFGASGGDLGELVVAMTQTDAFWYRAPNSQ
jgi:hypothetical protein